ncbi:MAG: hypothetical protein R3C18_20580 [Planctomycetaceae bacterium]
MIKLKLDQDALSHIAEIRDQKLPRALQNLTRDLMREGLEKIRNETPVDTGRAQAGWASAQQLSDSETGGSISNATAEGELTEQATGQSSSLTATNFVPYVPFLEYGTTRMRPFAMIRRALQELRQRVGQLFHFD